MALIELQGVGTVFGPDPAAALARARSGTDKAALLAQTGATLALLDVDLAIEAGEIFVVMGLSGSGKSTLLRHLNGLVAPTAGQVRVDGRELTAMAAPELIALRRRRLAMVFQRFGLLPHWRVIDNVAYGLQLRGVPRAERRRSALAWIDRVGLAGYGQHYPWQLSGGMQQRVGLARALAADTDIVLMDEAFSSLDPLTRGQLQDDLLALQRSLGKTIVFVSHDLGEALRIANRIAVLHDGRLLQVATPAQLVLTPADTQVAAFVHGVDRAPWLRVGQALVPWPADRALPALATAVDAEAPLDQVLPRMIGRSEPLAARRDGVIVGQVSPAAVRALLGASDSPGGVS